MGLALCLGIVLAGCATTASGGGGSGGSASNEMATSITGAGATFPQPVYEKIFQKAQQSNDIQVNYQPVGSSSGIEQFTQGTVDFGASDAPMTDSQVKDVNANVLHVATFGGAAVAAYNLKGVKDLNLTGTVLANIFMGKVKKWDDPAIAKLNPGAKLPNASIVTVHRSDGSGTTNMFTGYLDAISPEWRRQIGYGTEVNWPSGIGGDGNDGVAGQIKQNPNTMGYVGLEYAKGQGIPYANIGQTPGGPYITANVGTARAALEQGKIPSDLRVTVSTQAPFKGDAYPAVNYTFLLVQKKMDDLPTCKAVAATAWYITHQGQKLGPALYYVTLPPNVVSKDEQEIRSMNDTTLVEMACTARNVFDEGLDVFRERDIERARNLQAKDDKVDLLYAEAMNLIANPSEGGGGDPEWRMRAALMVHYLERISDHGVDIGGSTVFLVTGERIEDAMQQYLDRESSEE